MVLVEEQKETPAYATRKAPFFVYDCLKEQQTGKDSSEGKVKMTEERQFTFASVRRKSWEAGEYSVVVTAKDGRRNLSASSQCADL